MEVYAYKGDLKKLKPAGYKFQQLYARNYKTYSKGPIIMYVISKMIVEIDGVKAPFQSKLIDFILSNKDKDKTFWIEDRVYPQMTLSDMPIHVITREGNILCGEEWKKLRFEAGTIMAEIFKAEDAGTITEEEASKQYQEYNKWKVVEESLG